MRNGAGKAAFITVVITLLAAMGVGGGLRLRGTLPHVQGVNPQEARAGEAGPEDLDRAHEARIRAFPAKTEGLGAQVLQPKVIGGVKVFELVAREVQWEVEPGVTRPAFAYNGQVPGPTLRVTEGDRVRVILRNELRESTSIHFHGLSTPNAMDGVPFLTQPPVKPGQSFTYEFTARPVGSHMYHSHFGDEQITKGLLGAFIVDPRERSQDPRVDQDVIIVVNDGPLGFTLNGKSFPATQPIVVKKGQRIRIRYMNEGAIIHPMHLHGLLQTVIAKDGRRLIQPYAVDTVDVAPGERYDLLVEASEPGIWALHCHILSHAESKHGMHGMVTAVVVRP